MIGGVAVITYGYQRTTKNIDVTILCKLEEMKEIHNKFINEFTPLFDNSLDFFSKNFVLPSIDKKTNLKIYFAAGLTIFNDTIIQRRKGIKLGESEFYICTFKDLIIYKLFAGRYLDLGVVQMLVEHNKGAFDKKYLFQTAEKFGELEREDIMENLNKFLNQ